MSSLSRPPQLGDIVLLKQGIGVIRYYGEVDFDEGNKYFGVELKGPQISGGHNGTYNGTKYFETTGGDGRGIFIRKPIRIISSEEILEKLAEIYDILKGRRGHSHFIDRATYDDLYIQHEQLKEEYQDKLNEVDDLNMDLSLLKEQISMMRGSLGDKIEENANINTKIAKAEQKLGSRLSQFDLDTVKKQLEIENNQQQNKKKQPMEIPDYSQQQTTNNGKNKKGAHRKQRSSTTLELDQLQDNFSDIARTVQAYGQKDSAFSGPMHYRKYSNTTKQIMDQHKNAGVDIGQYGKISKRGHKARESMKIGDIVDENGIDRYESDEEQQQKLERESNDEEEEEENHDHNNDLLNKKRKKKTRQSRQSRQLDDEDVNNDNYFNDEQEIKERESNEEEEDEDENENENENENEAPKRTIKSRASRESRQMDDVEVTYDDENDTEPPKRTIKSRAARESRQLDDTEIDYEDEQDIHHNDDSDDGDDGDNDDDDDDDNDDIGDINNDIVTIQDDALGNNMQIDSMRKPVKRNKARGSFQLEQPILSASVLETHNEHHMEHEAAMINGPKGDELGNESMATTHKKTDTMTSDSSAYRAFMSVD